MCVVGRRISEINTEEIFNAYNSENLITKINIDLISKNDSVLNIRK